MAIHYSDYEQGSVTKLLETDLVLPQTRQALEERLQKTAVEEPAFFTNESFKIIKAVCDRLIPQDGHQPVDLAGNLDADLAANKGNGWRYNTMPPDQESFTKGVQGIDDTAQTFFNKNFTALQPDQQDEVLLAIQNSNVAEAVWQQLPPDLFFEELLGRLVEIYYCHPQVKDTIGDSSFADAHGWQQIQLNEKEAHEPMPTGGATI